VDCLSFSFVYIYNASFISQFAVESHRELLVEMHHANNAQSRKNRRVSTLEAENNTLRVNMDRLRALVLRISAYQFIKLSVLKKNVKMACQRLHKIGPEDPNDPSSTLNNPRPSSTATVRFHGPGKAPLTRFSDVNKKHRKFSINGVLNHPDAKKNQPLLAMVRKAKVDVDERFGRFLHDSLASNIDRINDASIRIQPYVEQLRKEVGHWKKTSDTFFARVVDMKNDQKETTLALQKAETRVATLMSLMKVHDQHYRHILNDKGITLDPEGNVVEARGVQGTRGSVIRAQKMRKGGGWGYMSTAHINALGNRAVRANERRAKEYKESEKRAEIEKNSQVHVKSSRISQLQARERTLTSRVQSLENQHRHLLTHNEILPDVVPSRLGDEGHDSLIPKQLQARVKAPENNDSVPPPHPPPPSSSSSSSSFQGVDVVQVGGSFEPQVVDQGLYADKDNKQQAGVSEGKEINSLTLTQGRLKRKDVASYAGLSLLSSMREATGAAAQSERPKSSIAAPKKKKRAAAAGKSASSGGEDQQLPSSRNRGARRARTARSAREPRNSRAAKEKKVRDARVNDVYVKKRETGRGNSVSRTQRLRLRSKANAKVHVVDRGDGRIERDLTSWKPTKELLTDPDEVDQWYESLRKEEMDDYSFLTKSYGVGKK
jgi:hypothetical protein